MANETHASLSPEEHSAHINALALVHRDSDGKPRFPEQSAAYKLLGRCDSMNAGQGSFLLLVPKKELQELGADMALWGRGLAEGYWEGITQNGKEYFRIPYDFAVTGLLPMLERMAQAAARRADGTSLEGSEAFTHLR